jgi:hypothetical protein
MQFELLAVPLRRLSCGLLLPGRQIAAAGLETPALTAFLSLSLRTYAVAPLSIAFEVFFPQGLKIERVFRDTLKSATRSMLGDVDQIHRDSAVFSHVQLNHEKGVKCSNLNVQLHHMSQKLRSNPARQAPSVNHQ